MVSWKWDGFLSPQATAQSLELPRALLWECACYTQCSCLNVLRSPARNSGFRNTATNYTPQSSNPENECDIPDIFISSMKPLVSCLSKQDASQYQHTQNGLHQNKLRCAPLITGDLISICIKLKAILANAHLGSSRLGSVLGTKAPMSRAQRGANPQLEKFPWMACYWDTLHLSEKLRNLAIIKGKVLYRQSKNAMGLACTNTKGVFIYKLLQDEVHYGISSLILWAAEFSLARVKRLPLLFTSIACEDTNEGLFSHFCPHTGFELKSMETLHRWSDDPS